VIFSGVKITDGQRKSLDNLIQDFIEKDQFSKEIILSTIKKTVYQSHQSKKN